jgi:arginine exporter protein ArgO
MEKRTKTILIVSSVVVLGGIVFLISKGRRLAKEKIKLEEERLKKQQQKNKEEEDKKERIANAKIVGTNEHYEATKQGMADMLADTFKFNPNSATAQSVAKALTNLSLGIQKK